MRHDIPIAQPEFKPRQWKTLPRSFYRRDARTVAPELLNKVIVLEDGRAGRIVEVEAYCGHEDPAAHSFRGPTPRTQTMFGDGGHLYVYFTYGMHYCANAVCGRAGEGVGVLLRAIEPITNIALMTQARGFPARARDIGAGPARLAQALGVDTAMDGADLVRNDRGIRIVDSGMQPPLAPVTGPRVGISKAKDHPWRWYVPDNPFVSSPGPKRRAGPIL